jgi:hypothetical protein
MASLLDGPLISKTATLGAVLLMSLVYLSIGEAGRAEINTSIAAAVLNVGSPDLQGWFERAHDLREQGLYVDREDTRWRSPDCLGESDYADARAATMPLIRAAELIAHGGDTPQSGPAASQMVIQRLLRPRGR